MSRGFVKRVWVWGILVLFCVSLNLLAAWHVPVASSGVFLHHEVSPTSQIPETVLWDDLLRRLESCGDTSAPSGNTTSNFYQQVRRFVDNEQKTGCFVPQDSSCHVTTVSVIVVSDGRNLRTLFLNLLPFISYAPVDSVTLIVKVDRKHLSSDRKYGQRMLDWDRIGTITLISVQASLWTAMEKVEPISEAIAWFNGDIPKNWNVAGLKTSLALWKENSRALIGSHVLQDKGFQVPVLHDLMMSRSYLCYLRNPPMDSFQMMAEENDSASSHEAFTILWSVLSGGRITIPSHRQNRTIAATKKKNISQNIIDYFGCSLHPNIYPTRSQNEVKTSCSTGH